MARRAVVKLDAGQLGSLLFGGRKMVVVKDDCVPEAAKHVSTYYDPVTDSVAFVFESEMFGDTPPGNLLPTLRPPSVVTDESLKSGG